MMDNQPDNQDAEDLVLSLRDVDEERSRAIHSIQYLASHVPTSVLKRLSEERRVQQPSNHRYNNHDVTQLIPEVEEHEFGESADLTVMRGAIDTISTDGSSDASDISDLSLDVDESDFHNSGTNLGFEGALQQLDSDPADKKAEGSLVGLDQLRQDTENQQVIDVVPDRGTVPQPPRRRRAGRRSSLASQVSILSHRYFLDSPALPYASKHKAAILFVDISGFTRLSTLLDPESLSKAINEYFELIVNEVTRHDGDILKFAGDALFAEWKVSSHRSIVSKSIESNIRMTGDDCITSAAICGAKIVAKFSDHVISANGGKACSSNGQVDRGLSLNVHCGISFGELVSVHVGDNDTRREYVVLGKPIDDVANATDSAELGQIAACANTIGALSRTCELDSSLDSWDTMSPVVIADHDRSMFTPTEAYSRRYETTRGEDPLGTRVERLISGWENAELLRFRKLLLLYVHPVVATNDEAEFQNPNPQLHIEERQQQEAELRNVFTMFISPQICVKVTGNEDIDTQMFGTLNAAMNLTTRELQRFGGHLRQYIVDDKGLVLIATFGLRGSTFPNMVADRALPAANVIHEELLSELNVDNRIGCTMGRAYCGVVGGLMRHEYAVLGPSVNLAARLMSSSENPSILVSDMIRNVADATYGFSAASTVKAKGFALPVPIFEPLSPLKRRWGQMQPNFVGRVQELKRIRKIALEMAQSSRMSRVILISGETGLGKSTLVVHAIDQIRRTMRSIRKRVYVSKHINRECDVLSPFGSFGSVLLSVMAREELQRDDLSVYSMRSFRSAGARSVTTMRSALSRGSVDGISTISQSKIAELLYALCHKLKAPLKYAEMVGQHLLGIDIKPLDKLGKVASNEEAETVDMSLVEFMGNAYGQFTNGADLSIIAMDDIHFADELSWKVLQYLFEVGTKILLIGTTRPQIEFKLSIDDTFWEELNVAHALSGRYTCMPLKPLDGTELRSMAAKSLGITEGEVTPHIEGIVLAQSSGIPQYARVILENMRKEYTAGEAYESSTVGSLKFQESPLALNQLILQRIDGFSGLARNIMNVAAVLGPSFEFSHLVEVTSRILSTKATPVDMRAAKSSAHKALSLAVQEGVLYTEYHGCDQTGFISTLDSSSVSSDQGMSVKGESVSYFFTHDVWRAAILKLMLGSLRRDIHRAVALTLEAAQTDKNMTDYLSQMVLFSHWRSSGDFLETGDLALTVGKTFEDLGLQKQCIRLYDATLDMWERLSSDDAKSTSAGFSGAALAAMTAADVERVMKLLIAKAKALATSYQGEAALGAYQAALMVTNEAKAGRDLSDRSIVFPIFSGLFLSLRHGLVKQDEDCSYEKNLVASFLRETELHGDPVHISRALAMQAEMLAKFGDFDVALSLTAKLRNVYRVKDHSDAICKAYGSDRAAQCISQSVLWLIEAGENEEALKTCDFVMNDLLPFHDIRNVHNSFVMIWPMLWPLKENKMSLVAKDLIQRRLIDAFEEYFGKDGFTFSLCTFQPLLMLFDLDGNQDGDLDGDLESYATWALCEENLCFDKAWNRSFSFGPTANLLSAEICLLLAKRLGNTLESDRLTELGLNFIEEAVALATTSKSKLGLHWSVPVMQMLKARSSQVISKNGS